MSEKQKQELKTKLKTCGLRMDFPFSTFTGFLILWKDEITGERRFSVSCKWSDAYSQFHMWAKSTEVEIWCVEKGQIKHLALSSEYTFPEYLPQNANNFIDEVNFNLSENFNPPANFFVGGGNYDN